MKKVVFGPQVETVQNGVFSGNGALELVFFKGKTMA